MGWDFWRIAWPNAAVVVALAVVPVWVIFTHSSGISQRTSIELASEPKATALATTDQRTYPHEEQWRE
jgi:hypothetical protein